MALTKLERAIVHGMQTFKMSKEDIVTVMLVLQDDIEGMIALGDYMHENPNATSQDILKKAIKTYHENNPQESNAD